MNPIHPKMLKTANDAAIYTLYLYLAHRTDPTDQESLRTIIEGLEVTAESENWSVRELFRLRILRNAVEQSSVLADSKIGNLTRSESGSTSCSFTNPKGDVFVVFRGTGGGEWIDNGEGLSGVPEENTYITYKENGEVEESLTIQNDYATDQQVEALNWFCRIAAENGWTSNTRITLAGHSKGGNKAQFITIHSDLVDECFSFDGQGFSPEAVAAFKKQHSAEFAARRRKIRSLSADNDYVNVLGERLMPDTQIYYFESSLGFHYLETMLDANGYFLPQSKQGKLSQYMETVSKELMDRRPAVRQIVTLGVMNVFQQYLGKETPVNADAVSLEKTIAGIAMAVDTLLDAAAF